MTMARRIGETTDEYAARKEEMGDEVWIKYLKSGDTKLRALEPVSKWTRYRYHFDPATSDSYPCVAQYGDECVGHKSPNERERSQATGYCFNALDKDGNLGVYRVNVTVKNACEMKEGRFGSVVGYDLEITKAGSGKDGTKWNVEKGDTYDIDTSAYELHDIPAILGQQYDAAAAQRKDRLGKEIGASASSSSSNSDPWKDGEKDQGASDNGGRIQAKGTAKSETKAAKPAEEPAAEPEKAPEPTPEPETPADDRKSDAEVKELLAELSITIDGKHISFEEMGDPELREWLAVHNGKSLPLNAARGVLIHEVKERLALGEAPF